VQSSVTIWYRGATCQLGRGPQGYGIWAGPGGPAHPLEQWPETPQGWAAAWSRFTALEPPASIVHLRSPAARGAGSARLAGLPIAVVLLAVGVICGVAGLFPSYLAGASLAHDPADLVTHSIYLAAWTASALLIQFGGGRARAAGLFGLGTSIVTFGFFLVDAGTVLASGAHVLGLGLVLSLVSWLACTAGAVLAGLVLAGLVLAGRPWPAGSRRQRLGVARAMLVRRAVLVMVIGLLALGAAAAFAPSWDSYTLRTSAGLTQTVTAGNIFANPGPVTAGDIAVMICFVVVAIVAAAATGRPGRLGAVLLAGALIPMAAEVISAVIGINAHVSPTEFGISPGQATQAGLTISAGLTPAFWIYGAFIAVLAGICGWLLTGPWPLRRALPANVGAQAQA
jgi:hypothetical protein